MLRMDHYPYSRFWAIWNDQDLVAVVVYKKGAVELLRRLQAPALPPVSAGPAAPATPTAPGRPGKRPAPGSARTPLAPGVTHGQVHRAVRRPHKRP
jgi:hypothetical protein